MTTLSTHRVIFVNRVYWPSEAATAQLLTDLAEGLVRRGWEVHVIAAGTVSGQRGGVQVHRTGTGAPHTGLFSRLSNSLGFLWAARRQLTGLLRPGDIVVLKTDPPQLAPVLSGSVRKRGAHLVHWVQDIYPEIAREHLGAWSGVLLCPWRWVRDWSWRIADHLIVVGTDMAVLPKTAGVPAASLTVCPNWAPSELERPVTAEAVTARRRAWDLEGKFLAVYSGNLGRVHEFKTILDAAARLQSASDVIFLFIGDGARYAEVRRAAASHGLRNVRFLPAQPRSELAVTLAAADVHFVTLRRRFESLVNPSKLAGILAAGRPTIWIGSLSSSNAALIRESSCGTAVAPGDGAVLAKVLLDWSHNRKSTARLGESARLCYGRNFTGESALEVWDRMLRALPSSRNGKRDLPPGATTR